MDIKQYHWLHIPTKTEGISTFNKYHAQDACATPYFQTFGTLRNDVALELINKWNASLPHEWKYWL